MPVTRKALSVEKATLPVRNNGLKRKRGKQDENPPGEIEPAKPTATVKSPHKRQPGEASSDKPKPRSSGTKSRQGVIPVNGSETAEVVKKATPNKRKGEVVKISEQELDSVPSGRGKKDRVSLKDKGIGETELTVPLNGLDDGDDKEKINGEIFADKGESEVKFTEPKNRKAQQKPHAKLSVEVKEEADEDDEEPQKVKKKRKTKEEKEAEAMPLAARTTGLKMFVGAHTSIAKGVENAISNCVHIGGNAFAMFLKSQRKWDNPALKAENRDAFRKHLIDFKYDAMSHVVPHGSYLVNLATEDDEQGKKSYDAFVDDLHRCEALGIKYYNFHPGAAGQAPLGEAINRLATRLNRALAETKTVTPLLENMAGHGSIIGGRFSDLHNVISLIKPEFQSRIGVCIDTCHAFASGYDLRTPESFQKTMTDFDTTVGMKYLKALHLNDSKAPFNSKRDLHQNIGLGFLGLQAFHNVMNEPHFQNLPLILETPCDRPDPSDPKGTKTIDDKSVWAKEIKLLESLIGMDNKSAEFKKLEKELSERGKEERQKMQKSFDDKVAKAKKKLEKEREKGQKSVKDMFGGKKKTKAAKDSSDEDSELSDEEI